MEGHIDIWVSICALVYVCPPAYLITRTGGRGVRACVRPCVRACVRACTERGWSEGERERGKPMEGFCFVRAVL